eukprot:TRINITY_DN8627_c0_g1_i2.p1 TRINITY_DN8627_c0_g1~~TRINITY_DN8627_c0_g1_i2.p1  ORF type:complete len:455 (-),score=122.33 TRINITY_DN8627_c0_g1_i2:592-1956(-)
MSVDALNNEEIKKLLTEKKYDIIRTRLANTDPADLADIMDELDAGHIEQIFGILDNTTASEVMAEMESDVDEFIDAIPPKRLAAIIQKMAPDDAVDILNELSTEEKEKVLLLLTSQEQHKLRQLSSYEDDSGGGIMTPELCAVNGDFTVEQTINNLAKTNFTDPVNAVFAVTADKKLIGYIHISKLISQPRSAKIKDVVEPNPVYAMVDEDQESIALKFMKYDLHVMPVVNENMVLVGRITADDVMDVIDEEAAEDFAHMAGAPDIGIHEDSPFSIVRLRLPWLLITMFTGMIVSLVVNRIINLNGAETMAAFVPVILAMGGNTGMQATAVTVRNIALGEIKFNHLMGVFARELMVGAMMGCVCGIIAAVIVYINLSLLVDVKATYPIVKLCIIVGFSMLTAMSFAAFSGTIMPIMLNRFKIDPAVASGPFVTTSNDLSASLIYLLMCTVLLSI